jgi:hypothetical protein
MTSLQFGMAGSGKPREVLTPLRQEILLALHAGQGLKDIAGAHQMTEAALVAEIQPLVQASLVQCIAECYYPTFFIADSDETRRIIDYAEIVGTLLAERLQDHWATLRLIYGELDTNAAFEDRALFLVGSRLLDIELLDVLAEDNKLMQPSPKRPSPTAPYAQYHAWMIAGTKDQSGRYGQSQTWLNQDGWSLLTFGMYMIDDQRNEPRFALEAQAAKATGSPREIAQVLGVPAYAEPDVRHWTDNTHRYARMLANEYYDLESGIRDAFQTLRASVYAPDSFSEFFCWYDHVAYSAAIDCLVAQGYITMPDDRFTAALWQGASIGSHHMASK